MNDVTSNFHDLSRKERILVITMAMLQQREEVLVSEIAKRADVSVGLIYRHFTDLDGLLKTAWARLFRSYEGLDQQVLETLLAKDNLTPQDLRDWFVSLFDPARDRGAWLRLEALVANRIGREPEPEVEAIRNEVINIYQHILQRVGLMQGESWPQPKVEAAMVLLTGIPLGVSAMMPTEMSIEIRNELAAAAVRAAAAVLELDLMSEFGSAQ